MDYGLPAMINQNKIQKTLETCERPAVHQYQQQIAWLKKVISELQAIVAFSPTRHLVEANSLEPYS